MSKIDLGQKVKFEELNEHTRMLDFTCSAQEKVLKDLELSKRKVREMRHRSNQL